MIYELATEAGLRYTEGGVIEASRVFLSDVTSQWPPTGHEIIPELGKLHPMEPGIKVREISWSLDGSALWRAVVSYSSLSGAGTLVPPTREIGTFRLGETISKQVAIPIAVQYRTEQVSGATTSVVDLWRVDATTLSVPMSQFTIEIIDRPPGFSDRQAINEFVGCVFEFVPGTGYYQFIGGDVQWLAQDRVRYFYRFVGDPGSGSVLDSYTSQAAGPQSNQQMIGGWAPDGTFSAGPRMLVPTAPRRPFSGYRTAPTGDATMPPQYATVFLGRTPAPDQYRTLPGMGWVVL